jgi:hypothetical protein
MLRVIPDWAGEAQWHLDNVHDEGLTRNELALLIARLQELNRDVEYILAQQWYSDGIFILAELPEEYGDDPSSSGDGMGGDRMDQKKLVPLPMARNRYEVQGGFDNDARMQFRR